MAQRSSLPPGPSVRPSLAPPASPLATLVRGLSRALRALGYYDAGHPMIVQTLAEAVDAVRALAPSGPPITLGGAGAALVHDVQAALLTDEPARIVADAMFQRSVIALRVDREATARDLAALLGPLADSPDRVRLAGGVAAVLASARAHGVEVVEVDFRAVFSGDRGSLASELTSDPVVARALREVLRFQEERGRVGEAVTIDFEALADVESLGGFLDDLVDAAEPAAKSSRDPGRRRPPPARSALQAHGRELSISVDEVADLAADAYLAHQIKRGASEGELVLGARALAEALVRLSPDGRFALLSRLAGQDTPRDVGAEQAVARLGAQLDGGLVVEAVASAIASEGADSEVVQAVGNLIRRLFPVEVDRRRLLGALDQERRSAGQPLGGALWQELNARALGQGGLGMLELDLVAPQKKLIANARARRRGGRVPRVAGQEILARVGPRSRAVAMSPVLVAALEDKRELSAALLAGVVDLVPGLEDAGDEARADELLDALLGRADAAPSEPLGEAIARLLGGTRGGARTVRLVQSSRGGSSKLRGELLLRAMEEAADKAFRDELMGRLLAFDPSTIEALGEALVDAPPARVSNLLQVATRMDGRTAALVAKAALKSASLRIKQLALKALIECPRSAPLALLGAAAGAKGEELSRRVLGLGSDTAAERRLHDLQLVAISALGLTRSAEAVPHLVPILTRQSLLPSRSVEEQRVETARALAVNGSADAIKVLRAGAEHKKKNIREACEKGLKR